MSSKYVHCIDVFFSQFTKVQVFLLLIICIALQCGSAAQSDHTAVQRFQPGKVHGLEAGTLTTRPSCLLSVVFTLYQYVGSLTQLIIHEESMYTIQYTKSLTKESHTEKIHTLGVTQCFHSKHKEVPHKGITHN